MTPAIRACIIMLLLIFIVLLAWLFAVIGRTGSTGLRELKRYRYAHRGLHTKPQIPENSMAAFLRAANHGYGTELDVHLTADGKLAVIHDESLMRTTGLDKKVADMTLEQLKCVRLEGTEETIPCLEEVLPLFAGKLPMIIEIKVWNGNADELTKKVCNALDNLPELLYCIESFDPRVLLWLKRNRPDIIRGQLSCSLFENKSISPFLAFVGTNLLENFITRPDFVAYDYGHKKNISLFLSCNIWKVQKVYWTIRTPQALGEADRSGAIAIFENMQPSPTISETA